ncbi:hypothetical protein Rs2_09710 [Raphanus sativus]|nr:hypothetical protein Rs2_09710 [Raphanus sativus]
MEQRNTEQTHPHLPTQSQPERSERRTISEDRPFQQRVDRYGRSYGDRVSTKQTRVPPPIRSNSEVQEDASRAERPGRNDNYRNTSPQYVHSRRHHPYESTRRRTPFPPKEMKEWRAKDVVTQPAEKPISIRDSPQENTLRNRQETYLASTEGLAQIPTQAEVMEQLHEVTLQYLSCADPTEAAARQRRVLASDNRGLTEETAARIIRTAQLAASSPHDNRDAGVSLVRPILSDQGTPNHHRSPP